MTGTLYLIPVPIAEGAVQTLSQEVSDITLNLEHYFAENLRTARRFLRSLHKDLIIDTINFSEIDKHSGPDIPLLKKWLNEAIPLVCLAKPVVPALQTPVLN